MRVPLHHFVGALAAVASSSSGPQLKMGSTTLTGRNITGLGLEFYGGIPYAEPPLGSLRLQPPVLKKHLGVKTFDASDFGKGCFQNGGDVTTFTEDCLTINVYRPAGTKGNAKLPVMFWTYGGGFQGGVSSIYNASLIVAQSVARGTPIIYVSYNYRLGPLGFPQGQESADKGALNLALKDQLAALQWVQSNIGDFGGDKSKVTVSGESAGAIMTAILFLGSPSPLEGLARAAIFESGSAATQQEFPAARRQVDWQNFVAGVPSCASLALTNNTYDCLRTANTSEIYSGVINGISNSPETFGYDPTIDGPGGIFPDIPSTFLKAGKFAKLPFIAGTNLDEGTAFVPPAISTDEEIEAFLTASFSPPLVSPEVWADAVTTLMELYPNDPTLGSPYNTGTETFGLNANFKRAAAMSGDISFQAQRRNWIQTASNAGVKTYGYLFTQPQPNALPAAGVAHGSEVTFVYGVPGDNSTSAQIISTRMIDYWLSFATSLDPNDGKGLVQRPKWTQYTPKNQAVLQLNGANTTMIPDTYRQAQMAFINSDPPLFHQRRRSL